MRPFLALAILLLGLKAAVPEVKVGSVADVNSQGEKFQDRVPSDDEGSSSSADAETAASIGKSGIGESEISESGITWPQAGTSEIGARDFSAPAIKKSDRAATLPAPPATQALDAAHDQGDAATEPQPPAPATTDADADANVIDSVEALCSALMTSAQENNLPVPFFANLIWQESRLQRDSVSKAGALGIAQFMPEVATEVGLADPFDPRQAIPASARFLRVLRQHFGNLGYVAAAYNAGAHRVGDWLDHGLPLPQETRTYVLRVTGRSAEAWRKSAPDDSELAFAPSLPCRRLPAFAELEQSQLRTVVPNEDAKDQDAGPQQQKIATHVAHLPVRKVAARVAARTAARLAVARGAAARAAATRVAARAAAKSVVRVASRSGGGSVAHPLVTIIAASKAPARAARAAAIVSRNIHVRRDAMRRPPVPHERRRVA